MHHGGAATTAAAAKAGVPQVIVPHLLDQFYWAERVHRQGLGPAPCGALRLTAADLARAIRAALDDPACRRRAKTLGAHLQTTDGLNLAADVIEAIAARQAPTGEVGRAAAGSGSHGPS